MSNKSHSPFRGWREAWLTPAEGRFPLSIARLGAQSGLQRDDELDLDARVAGQLCHANGTARMPAAFAEDRHQQLRGGVDDLGLLVERRRRGDEPGYFQDPIDAFQ